MYDNLNLPSRERVNAPHHESRSVCDPPQWTPPVDT